MEELLFKNDFDVTTVEEPLGYNCTVKKYFFKQNNNLIGHIRVHFITRDYGGNWGIQQQIYIRDTTSASGYVHMTSEMQQVYNENGYNPNYTPKGKAHQFLEYVLRDIQEHHNDECGQILMGAIEGHEKFLLAVIQKVQDTTDLILEIGGGGEFCEFTLKVGQTR